MNETVILFCRNSQIFDNRDKALVELDRFTHKPGQPVIAFYYEDVSKTTVNSITVVGQGDGIGRKYYNILSTQSEFVVNGVYETLPDVSRLIHGGTYISKVNGVWKYIVYNGTLNLGEAVTIPHIGCIRDLASGYNWYNSETDFKREDNFYTKEQIVDVIVEEIGKAILPTFGITLTGGNKYDKADFNPFNPVFNVSIIDYLGNNITSKFTFTVTSDVRGGEPIQETTVSSTITLANKITGTTEYTITATRSPIVLTKKIKIYVVPKVYPALVTNPADFSNPVALTDGILWIPEDGPLKVTSTMINKYFGVYVPAVFPDFSEIHDNHGFDFTGEYDKVTDIVYSGNSYKLYKRREAITINNFKQIFTV